MLDIDIDHFRKKLLASREAIHGLTDTRNVSTATVVLDQTSYLFLENGRIDIV